jgi:hypothetical protein
VDVRPASAAAAFIVTSLLLLTGIRSAQAAEIKIASPGAYKDREGSGIFDGVDEPPYRYQQVFPATDFAELGNQPHWIVGFGPRADESVESPHTAYLPDNYVRLSTTQQRPGNHSLVFDDNFGSDVIDFYSGPLTMVADVSGPGSGPKGFYQPDFAAGVTPFLYDPSKGNLLFDFIAREGESTKILADQIPSQLTVAGDSFAAQGSRGFAAIFQFTFVPVTRPGDYNHNGTLDAADIDDLTSQTAGGANPASYDLNADTLVDARDIKVWVGDLFHSWIGDANLDGQFNSSDLVTVLAAGTYEVDVDSIWSTGDFNGDGRTNSSDLVAALADGGYEMGPRAAVASVPEPATLTLWVMAAVTLGARRRSSVSSELECASSQ